MARVLKGTLEALGHMLLLAQQNILSLYNNQHGSQNYELFSALAFFVIQIESEL